jgi:hypothetical protein
VCETAIGVLTLTPGALDDSVETHEVTQNDAHFPAFRLLGHLTCRRDTRPKLIANEHVAIRRPDLARMLPNRGAAMVYLHKKD